MIADERVTTVKVNRPRRSILVWLNIAVTALLAGVGIWYISRRVTFAEIGNALLLVSPGLVASSIVVVCLIVLIKVWRWRLILADDPDELPLLPLFWATTLGNYVNLLLPILRMGDIARAYAFKRQTSGSSVRALTSIAVEKALNMVMLFLSLVVVLPFLTLPDYVSSSGVTLGIVSLALLLSLYVLAYQTQNVVNVFHRLSLKLPAATARRLIGLVVSGLEGVSSLRDQRKSTLIVVTSAALAFLSVIPPYLLLLAFEIPLGLAEAGLINVVATIALTPPSTPAKIGIFDGAVVFALVAFGLKDDATIASFTVVYHLVVVLPLILIGSVAASQTGWSWKTSKEASELTTTKPSQ